MVSDQLLGPWLPPLGNTYNLQPRNSPRKSDLNANPYAHLDGVHIEPGLNIFLEQWKLLVLNITPFLCFS